jgi:hypothetical protein
MKGITASIFVDKKFGDCSNGGISSRYSRVTVIGLGKDAEIFEPTEDAPAVRLVKRKIGGKVVVHAEPVEGLKSGNIGWMAGGSYVSTSDSRFCRAVGFYGAVSLHDRQETPEMYDQLSR